MGGRPGCTILPGSLPWSTLNELLGEAFHNYLASTDINLMAVKVKGKVVVETSFVAAMSVFWRFHTAVRYSDLVWSGG